MVARPRIVGLGTSGTMAFAGQRDGSVRFLVIRGEGGGKRRTAGLGADSELRAHLSSGSQTAGLWHAHLPSRGICPLFPGHAGVVPAGAETPWGGQQAVTGARGAEPFPN